MQKILRYPKFSETLKGCSRNFSALRDQNVSPKNVMPHIMHKIFRYPKFYETLKGCKRKIFRQCEAKKYRLKVVICPLLSTNFFKNQIFSGKRKGSFTKLFVSVLWDTKQFDETVMHPYSYARKFSSKNFFWNTKVFSNETFWYSQTKTFSPENRDITPFLSLEDFSFQKFSKTKNVSPAKFSRSCEKNNFDKIVKLPPSFAWKSSIPESFRNTEGFFYELYRHSETKNFQRSSVISPFYAKNFGYPKFSDTPKCSPT